MKKLIDRFQVKDSGLIIDLMTGKTFSANSTGLAIFRGLIGRKNRSELVESVTREFDIDAATAARDVDEFLVELKAFNFDDAD